MHKIGCWNREEMWGGIRREGRGVSAGLQAIDWMEEHFCGRDMSLVVVTHDRAFMEAVCTSVLEMEAGEVHLHSFGGPGSYARFQEVNALCMHAEIEIVDCRSRC